MVGFSPGFAYLDGLAPRRCAEVPRRDRPRPVVPAGSVALANGHAAVYPTASPGGWQLVGRTGFPLFSLDGPPYAALAPGDRVQFARRRPPAKQTEPRRDSRRGRGRRRPGRVPSSRCWRRGCAPSCRTPAAAASPRRGCRPPGAADPVSCALANGAGRQRARGRGARGHGRRDAAARARAVPRRRWSARRRRCASTAPTVAAGAAACRWRRGRCSRSARCGGGAAPTWRWPGACSGPRCSGAAAATSSAGWAAGPLRSGRRAVRRGVGPAARRPPGARRGDASCRPEAAGRVARRARAARRAVRPGRARTARGNVVPRRERQQPGRPAAAAPRRPWTGGRGAGELDSQPMVTGAVQLPPGGEPVVLGPDHATLGGYPVPAVVITADHGLLGQCGPGTAVRLVPVGLEEAEAALAARRRALAAAVERPLPAGGGLSRPLRRAASPPSRRRSPRPRPAARARAARARAGRRAYPPTRLPSGEPAPRRPRPGRRGSGTRRRRRR